MGTELVGLTLKRPIFTALVQTSATAEGNEVSVLVTLRIGTVVWCMCVCETERESKCT